MFQGEKVVTQLRVRSPKEIAEDEVRLRVPREEAAKKKKKLQRKRLRKF